MAWYDTLLGKVVYSWQAHGSPPSLLPLAGIFPNRWSSMGHQRLVHMVAEQQARPAATLHKLYPQELPSDVDSLHGRAYEM
jgi:hypothetical protein